MRASQLSGENQRTKARAKPLDRNRKRRASHKIIEERIEMKPKYIEEKKAWYLDQRIEGRRYREWFSSEQAAENFIAEIKTRARATKHGLIVPKPIITVTDLREKIIPTNKNSRALRAFDKFIEVVGSDLELYRLGRVDWKAYTTYLEEKNSSPTTINRYMGWISSILNSAGDYFRELEDWRPAKAPWMPRPPGRSRIIEKVDIKRIFEGCLAPKLPREFDNVYRTRLEIYDLLRLLLLTGAREGEIMKLEQNKVLWDRKTLLLYSSKGMGVPTPREIPLAPTAMEILFRRRSPVKRRFFDLTQNKLIYALPRIGELSGVPYGKKLVDGWNIGWIVYDFRHTAATAMESGGVAYSTVAAILGHKRKDMTATYTHARNLKSGIDFLESFLQEIERIDLSEYKVA